ncbi:MAG: hypothetical protein JWR36_943 [Glaciihabitans sp.]|jgi:hypothetical protein|nr:hypothetical protein [Glaciihabitans sp.]MDQ1571729.1 hypothetical protein [Actinomycetota bacterium]
MTNVITTFSPAFSDGAETATGLATDIAIERGRNRVHGFGIAIAVSVGLWAAIGYGIWSAVTALS